ncbi:PREDICTED: centrosomal protein C10orf90 homolog [Elephantulus edwardii]|uniref:centrosomal protein C10orf90 homolog n=1 Tax=Elephantulus edwardii TaxID=28737 RepID=UPI0003F0C25C|nr:PREDICTED: centrosomal protein C10orf90 homolog [Elephantulus edwardii]
MPQEAHHCGYPAVVIDHPQATTNSLVPGHEPKASWPCAIPMTPVGLTGLFLRGDRQAFLPVLVWNLLQNPFSIADIDKPVVAVLDIGSLRIKPRSLAEKEPLGSEDMKVISSLAISQLTDEKEPRRGVAVVPARRALAQSSMHHRTPCLAGHSGVDIHRALSILPSRLGTQIPAHVPGPRAEWPPQEKIPWREPHRGFASITVTARRVGPPASTLLWKDMRNPLCRQCPAGDTQLMDPSPLARAAGDPCRPLAHTAFSRTGSAVQLRVPEAQPWACEERVCWVSRGPSGENSFSPGSLPAGKGPLMFSSCVHLRVSQPCSSSMYYLDKSLSVPIEPPVVASPQVHRSVLSLHLNCSSHTAPPEGDDGLANQKPMGSALGSAVTLEKQRLVGPSWTPGLRDSYQEGHPAWTQAHLGDSTCPWSSPPALEKTGLTGLGTDRTTVREGSGDHRPSHHAGHAGQLTIHIPGWSFAADTKVFSGSKKQQREPRMTLSAPPVERKPVKDFLPNGGSSPKGAHQSGTPSEPTESQHQSFPGPRAPQAGFLSSLEDERVPQQDIRGVQVQRECPEGAYTCCDLTVNIKDCKKGEEVPAPQPSSAPPDTDPPGPVVPEEQDILGLLEDHCESQQAPGSSLTLQEALEAHKPQFISRSQERLKKLEHMVEQRKAQQAESQTPRQSLQPPRANRKQFTVPHPLSDNLFKPKERCISEKEMYTRSKRIYNNLPEVKKKKEEQKKRVILQSNRLRAEVFKKQLLDQLLQRNAV